MDLLRNLLSPDTLSSHIDYLHLSQKYQWSIENFTWFNWTISETLPDALASECSKCNEKQKEAAEKIIKHLMEKKPKDWERLLNKYDPKGEYRKKYEEYEASMQKKNWILSLLRRLIFFLTLRVQCNNIFNKNFEVKLYNAINLLPIIIFIDIWAAYIIEIIKSFEFTF